MRFPGVSCLFCFVLFSFIIIIIIIIIIITILNRLMAPQALRRYESFLCKRLWSHDRTFIKTFWQSGSSLHLHKQKYVWNNLNERFYDIYV